MDVIGETIHLASAADNRYVPHVATLIESIADSNRSAPITFHFLHDATVTARATDQLRELCDGHGMSLELLQPTDDLEDFLPAVLRSSHYPGVIWYRARLAELLPSRDRAVYLDPDTLVLQDLRALWNADLAGRLLGAVRRDPPPVQAYSPVAYQRFVTHGYFSSGAMLLDLKRMREEMLFSRVVEAGLMLDAEPLFPEQDVMNLACEGSWLELHPKWNTYASLYFHKRGAHPWPKKTVSEAVNSPAILHFESPIYFRPWSVRCIHPHRELYREYRSRTPWPLAAPEASGLKDRFLGALPIPLQVLLIRVRNLVSSLLHRPGAEAAPAA